jgi:hypothetical protein
LLFCSFVCSFVFDDESAGLAAAIDPTGTKKPPFPLTFYTKAIVLPRHARDRREKAC